MKTEHFLYFDLPTLFVFKELNVRQFSDNTDLSAKEYFDILISLVDNAPEVSDALKKFAKMDGDINAYRRLDDMASTLKSLHCDRLSIELYSLMGAYENGNWRLAAVHAESLVDNFNQFVSRLKAARRTGVTDTFPDTTIPLKEYLGLPIEKFEPPRKKIILAIDDSPVVLNSVSSVLSGEYKVYTLPKPTELEKVLKKLTPDLFLLDYQMPDINGFELIPIIRSYEEHKKTPIIFLTSLGTIENLTSAIALGACDFTVKPFRPDQLRQKIAKHIAGNQ